MPYVIILKFLSMLSLGLADSAGIILSIIDPQSIGTYAGIIGLSLSNFINLHSSVAYQLDHNNTEHDPCYKRLENLVL